MNKFEGTMFRFPLRSATQFRESLLVSKDFLNYSDLKGQLDEIYFKQAKRSLILLRNLKQIEFNLGDEEKEYASRSFTARWNITVQSKIDWITDTSRKE